MSNPAPGWYPAPHANGEQRYWDGSQWVESTSPAPEAAAVSYPPQASPTTSKPKALALSALIVGIVAFLTGLLPVVGIVIGIAAIVLGILALARKQSKGMGVTGIILGSIAALVSVAMTIGLTAFTANLPHENATSAPAPTESIEPEPSPEPTTEAPPVSTTPDLSTFTETDDRNWALIAKDPDAHAGTNLILYGSITQFDSATGRCAMLIDTAATLKEMSFDYEQSVMAVSGDWETECPTFDPLVEADHVKIWATVVQSFSYDTQIGGNTTVPMVEVWQAELLPATEY